MKWQLWIPLCGLVCLVGAIGANPRYLENLKIGGGYGDSVDGGADLSYDGSADFDGQVRSDTGVDTPAITAPDDLTITPVGGDTFIVGTLDVSSTLKLSDNLHILDDKYIKLGTDRDIWMGYDEDGDNRLEWTDGTNRLMSFADAGTTGNLVVTGTHTVDGGLIQIRAAANPALTIEPTSLNFSANQQSAFGVTPDGAIRLRPPSNSTGGGWLLSANKAAASGLGAYYQSLSENDLTTWASHYFDTGKHDGAGSLTDHSASAKLFVVANNGTDVLTTFGNGNTIFAADIASKGAQFGDGGATDYVDIEATTGDMKFVGGAGLSFADVWGIDGPLWSQANAANGDWYNVVAAGMTSGNLHNITHDGNGKLTVSITGKYEINFSCSVEANAANVHIEIGIIVDGSEDAVTHGFPHCESKFANEEESVGGSMILDLTASSYIEFAIRTIDVGTPDLEIHNINITMKQIGG